MASDYGLWPNPTYGHTSRSGCVRSTVTRQLRAVADRLP